MKLPTNGTLKSIIQIATALVMFGIAWARIESLVSAVAMQSVKIESLAATVAQTNISVAEINIRLETKIEESERIHAGLQREDDRLDQRLQRLERRGEWK